MDIISGLLPGKSADKLKIESWPDIKRKGTASKTFTAFINPDEFTLNYSVLTESTNAAGANGSAGGFLGTKPLEVSLKFFLDGTNANGVKLDVPSKIREFYETIGYDGKVHRTSFLRITWGHLTWLRTNQYEFDCELKTTSIQYKLFKFDGTPLRVIISATFAEKVAAEKQLAEDRKESPDLTHVRIVKEGDTLPGMVEKIYGDFKYYLEVARINKLQNFRDLQPGQKLIFPPFDKTVKQSKNV
ncbi:hypothetical protein GS399_01700 [Pedobacter sp. HMF7647]|uniref:LysM domain-containing protein n=1 Tax=Hufsiella arboris TaxID=2695275 RepID=A0A7K1Y5H3_9SPHI|nr:LysM peptidoglycan-binding domain-containing protein [Hufsiella arboris]MXV49670.1 hypothetical protein [Hufsiella arboris]